MSTDGDGRPLISGPQWREAFTRAGGNSVSDNPAFDALDLLQRSAEHSIITGRIVDVSQYLLEGANA